MLAHMTSFVRISRAGVGSFAKVNSVEGNTVSPLAERACTECQLEGGLCAAVPVPRGCRGDDVPTLSAVDSARHLDQIGWSLTRAGISSGAWLVARKIVDGGAF